MAVALCALLGFAAPALFGLAQGVREPGFHDEYSYLLAADTFARGRLTNPAPELPEFFEAEHVLVAPTYMSKYPPGQGLFLAAGQVVFGHPIWGVWLSCGAFAASLCWMLQSWTSRRWALLTTLVVIFGAGISSYWAQSYWGGMAAATGSALLFGGMRRSIIRPRTASSVMMGAGMIALAITRPFEGLLVCLAAAGVMARWLICDRRFSFSDKARRWALPLGLVCLSGGAGMARYNQAVTGDWRSMPYSLHQRQYFYHGVFCGSPQREPERRPCSRIARYYEEFRRTTEAKSELLATIRGNLAKYPLRFAYTGFSGTRRGGERPWMRTGALTLAAIVFIFSFANRWTKFCWTTIGATLALECTIWWWHPHYSAPLFPLLYVSLAQALRTLSRRSRWRIDPRGHLPVALMGLSCLWLLATDFRPAEENIRPAALSAESGDVCRIASRAELRRRLLQEPGRHLVFVHYDETCDVHNEWVYNAADMNSAPIIFAHDLGREKNAELIDVHHDRRVWRVSVSVAETTLETY
jgi:hypothetical protein